MYNVRVYHPDNVEHPIVEGNDREAVIEAAEVLVPGLNLIVEETRPDGRVTGSITRGLVGMGF